MDPRSRAPKKNTSHENEVPPQDTTRLLQRPCCQRGSPCRDPAGNRTTRRPPDHRQETQTVVVWSRLPFIRSGQNHLERYSERGKKTRQTEGQVGRQHQGMDRPGVRQVPEGIIIIIIIPLTARVVGAPQIILQPVFSIFPCSPQPSGTCQNSRPVHSLMLSSHLFLCLPCLLPPFTVPRKMVLARPDERET